MIKKKIVINISYITIFFLILILMFYFGYRKKEIILTNEIVVEENIEEENYTSSNLLKNVKYSAKDINGNELVIEANSGEIDSSNKNIIFLTDVEAYVIFNNKESIKIKSNFGKYNIDNYDTIFSKSVVIDYLENKITGEYVDFSLERNSLIASKNIIYTNNKNILNADVITMDINTKDIKIQMYENEKKVNIKSK
ncbi:LPS export ABC transporter periplasmic protein LptC [Candidatus Pelagibacter sp.]|nr:LPS export ABC transporter periplasmic protein LptC [Candidatus Pelagibacter sp.]